MFKRFHTLALAGWLAWSIATAATAGLEPAFRLNQLALAIVDGPAPLRADLARIAIGELAAVYADEARRARHDPHRSANGKGQGRWAAAVQQLADDYAALARSITLVTPVTLDTGPDGSLYLVVDGRLVVAGSPRMNEQALFEQHVIAEFCTLNRCDGLVEVAGTPVPDASSARSTLWLFSDHAGPVCSNGDGLEFQFNSLAYMDQRRVACQQVVSELNLLAGAIVQRVAGGTRVDWNAMAIHGAPAGAEHALTLNPEGDSLRLPLPELAARPELFKRVLPWLAAKVQGQGYSLVVLDAGRLLDIPASVPQ